MTDRTMRGVFPILAMPFDEQGRIVHEELRREVEWAIGAGVHGLGIAMASEVYKLSEDERDAVLRTVVDQAGGRAKVVMNTGGEGTNVTIENSLRAQDLGADALMIRPTSYIPTTVGENVEFFVRIARAVDLPIFMQDQASAPAPPALAARCAREHENLCYVKVETPPTVPRMAEANRLRGDSGLILFGGAGGSFAIEEFRRGSVGTMPHCATPEMFVRVWDLWQDGREAEAEAEFHRHAALLRTLSQPLGLANWLYKEVLVQRGVLSREASFARHPSQRPDDLQLRELSRLLDELGLREG